MQIILVGAAVINQVFTGQLGTTVVLIGLTIFNAFLGFLLIDEVVKFFLRR